MLADTRWFCFALVWIVAMAGGCASFRTSSSRLPPMPTPEQSRWWEENRARARYVPGRGYYVDGVSGFFDQNGRPLPAGLTADGFADEEDEDDGTLLGDLSATNTYKRFKVLIGKGPNEAVAKRALEEGDGLFRQKDYKAAAKKYKVAYQRWPDSPLEEEALFKAGEALFFSDHYADADDAYGLLVKKYPGTHYLDRTVARRFAIARYWEQHHNAHPHWPVTPNLVDNTRPLFDTHGNALHIYERVRLDDPTGPLADDSIMATANAYFVQGRYEEADYYYALLRSEYPKSEHQFQAHLLGLRSKLLKYQGPDYNGAPLDEADELIQQLLTQFPAELGNERERLVQARAEVRAQKALREYKRGEYYHKGEYYAASRMHFNQIVQEYPDTRLALEAQARLEEGKGQPDRPRRPFDWMLEIFPDNNTEAIETSAANVATAPGGVQR